MASIVQTYITDEAGTRKLTDESGNTFIVDPGVAGPQVTTTLIRAVPGKAFTRKHYRDELEKIRVDGLIARQTEELIESIERGERETAQRATDERAREQQEKKQAAVAQREAQFSRNITEAVTSGAQGQLSAAHALQAALGDAARSARLQAMAHAEIQRRQRQADDEDEEEVIMALLHAMEAEDEERRSVIQKVVQKKRDEEKAKEDKKKAKEEEKKRKEATAQDTVKSVVKMGEGIAKSHEELLKAHAEQMEEMKKQLLELHKAIKAPRKLVRDKRGKITGSVTE